jgi:hypothetical protein
MGQWLSERLGRSFVVENRTGAGSNIATETEIEIYHDSQPGGQDSNLRISNCRALFNKVSATGAGVPPAP